MPTLSWIAAVAGALAALAGALEAVLKLVERFFPGGRHAARRNSSQRWFKEWRRPVALLFLGTLILAGGVAWGRQTAPPYFPDGTSPRNTICEKAAKSIESLQIFVPSAHLFGILELRRSDRCHTSWARVSRIPGEGDFGQQHIVVTIVRPGDGKVDRVPFSGPTSAAFTNMMNNTSCVYAEAQVRLGKDSSPLVRTPCR